ncbi:MAG: alpha/beta hydrolase [Pseudomonadota bacterium]
MGLDPAPYYHDIAHCAQDAAAYWAHTADGVRIRLGHWPRQNASGTVLIFPGRTEFIEKYARIAQALSKRGLASLAIDWRGQGMADRLLDNPMIGHVARFTDYQKDVAAMVEAAQSLDLPRPFYLLAHSMGGAIGLRALMAGLEVDSVVFSGPMWGLQIKPHLRGPAWGLSLTMPLIGQGHRLPPGSKLDHHVLAEAFENNLLTRDRAEYEIMRQQLIEHPELGLGGPSYVWLREALLEIRPLARRPSPRQPCLTLLGSNERIVDIPAIHHRMADWPGGRLEIVPDGEHEVLMESAEITEPLFDLTCAHFLTAPTRA